MATNTNIIHVRRGAGNTWVVGIPKDQLAIPGVTDKSGMQQISMTRQIQSAHQKDADGVTRLSKYTDVSTTGNLSLCYPAGQRPEPGDVVLYTDDKGVVRAMQILSVGQEYNAQNACAMLSVSLEHYDGWEDDESVAKSGTQTSE